MEEIKKATVNLNELMKNTMKEMKKRSMKPYTNENLRNAEFNVIEAKVTKIIHQDEISISTLHGAIKAPVYLDANFNWFLNRESIIPFMNPPLGAECLKAFNERLIVCYPLEDLITEFITNSILFLKTDLKVNKNIKTNQEDKA